MNLARLEVCFMLNECIKYKMFCAASKCEAAAPNIQGAYVNKFCKIFVTVSLLKVVRNQSNV